MCYEPSSEKIAMCDEMVERYAAGLQRADQHRLDVETRSFSGEKLKAETERRKNALIEAHRRVADEMDGTRYQAQYRADYPGVDDWWGLFRHRLLEDAMRDYEMLGRQDAMNRRLVRITGGKVEVIDA